MEEEIVQTPQEAPLEPMEDSMLQQQIKIILLKQRPEYLVGAVTELDEEPSILIEGCYEVTDDGLVAFPKHSAQRDMFLTSDVVLSILDPSDEVLKLYNAK